MLPPAFPLTTVVPMPSLDPHPLAVVLVAAVLLGQTPTAVASPCVAKLATTSTNPEMMGPTSVSMIQIDDCGSTSGDGGTPDPDDPTRFVGRYHGETIRELRNPLARFQHFTVDVNDADGVIDLLPLPLPADRGSLKASLEAITNAEIVAALVYFGLDTPALMSGLNMVLTDPAYQDLKEDVAQQLQAGEFRAAVSTLMAQKTPMDVTLWCGDDKNPVELPWVLVIPVTMPCTLTPGAARVVYAVAAVERPAEYLPVPAMGSPAPAQSANTLVTTYSAGYLTANARPELSGFTYAAYGAGAWTDHAKRWSLTFRGQNLTPDDKVTTLAGVTFRPMQASAFEAADHLYLTQGHKLSRATTFNWTLTRSESTIPDLLLEIRPDYKQGIDYLRLSPAIDSAHPFKTVTFHANPRAGIEVASEIFPAGDSLAMQVRARPLGSGIVVDMRKPPVAPGDKPQDAWEAKHTFYVGGLAVATTQVVGGSAEVSFHFAPTGEERPGRVEASLATGAEDTEVFRTWLATWHGAPAASATGDYLARASMLVHPTYDPIARTYRGFILHGARLEADWSAEIARLQADTVNTTTMRWAHDNAEGDGALWWLPSEPDPWWTAEGDVGIAPVSTGGVRAYFWPISAYTAQDPGSDPPGVTYEG